MINQLRHLHTLITESEKSVVKLIQEPLPVDKADVSGVLSEENLSLHYDMLAKGYVTRYNHNDGDSEFNYNGATLHNIFFAQLKPVGNSSPSGTFKIFLNSHFTGGFSEFRTKFEETALTIQGSGWIYLNHMGEIKLIKNHNLLKSQKIVLLIDMWEHSYIIDYGSDKKKYLKSMWKIIDWNVINNRLINFNSK